MKSGLNLPRLLAELIATVALADVGVMYARPVIALGVGANFEALLAATLLLLLVAPVMMWRCSVAFRQNARESSPPPALHQRCVLAMSAATFVVGLGLTALFVGNQRHGQQGETTALVERLLERLTAEFTRRVNQPV